MKYSFCTWTYSSGTTWLPVYPIEETLRRIAAKGYDAAELVCAAPHAWPDFMTPEKIKSLRKAYEDNKLACSSIFLHPGGGSGYNACSFDEIERDCCVTTHKKVIDIAYELECPTLLYIAGWYGYGVSRKQAWQWSMDGLNQIADYAGEKGMIVCVEPTASASNLVENGEDALQMMEESGRENVYTMLDIEHVLYRKEVPVDSVYRMGKTLRHIHLTDDKRIPPGCGPTDFLHIIQALKDIGYPGYLTVEAGFDNSMSPDDVARVSIEYLKSVEKKLV